jgi:hypothetical protein
MPEKATIERARKKKRAGYKASTQAGEFVREEMHHKAAGKHKVKNRKQAVAIGLSKARNAGIKVPKKKSKKKTTTQKKTRDRQASAR